MVVLSCLAGAVFLYSLGSTVAKYMKWQEAQASVSLVVSRAVITAGKEMREEGTTAEKRREKKPVPGWLKSALGADHFLYIATDTEASDLTVSSMSRRIGDVWATLLTCTEDPGSAGVKKFTQTYLRDVSASTVADGRRKHLHKVPMLASGMYGHSLSQDVSG